MGVLHEPSIARLLESYTMLFLWFYEWGFDSSCLLCSILLQMLISQTLLHSLSLGVMMGCEYRVVRQNGAVPLHTDRPPFELITVYYVCLLYSIKG